MNIVVFVKRVPDTESKIRIQHETSTVVEEGLNFVISPNDEYAVEEGLRLREAQGGKVTAVSLGGDEALTVLRKCLAMGVDEALLIKDDRKETYDGLRVARILAAAVQARFADADLLLFGRLSVGADNAQVPAMTAELLGWPQATVVTKLADRGPVRRRPSGRSRARSKKSPSPCRRSSRPRRASTSRATRRSRASWRPRRRSIPVVTPAELGLTAEDIAPQVEILSLETPPAKAGGTMIGGTPEEAARELVRLLRDEAKVI